MCVKYAIRAEDIRAPFQAAQSFGGTVTYDLNFVQNSTATWALQELLAIKNVTGNFQHVKSLEIGNEPDLFGGVRAPDYSVSTFAEEWQSTYLPSLNTCLHQRRGSFREAHSAASTNFARRKVLSWGVSRGNELVVVPSISHVYVPRQDFHDPAANERGIVRLAIVHRRHGYAWQRVLGSPLSLERRTARAAGAKTVSPTHLRRRCGRWILCLPWRRSTCRASTSTAAATQGTVGWVQRKKVVPQM